MKGRNHVKSCIYVMTASVVTMGCQRGADSIWLGHVTTGIFSVNLVFFAGWAALGSLLPDIDSKTSTLGRHIHLPFGHRTWTHSIWAVILIALLCWKLPLPGADGLGFGYILHLLLDSVSQMGICWFYPFKKYVYMEDGVWKRGSGDNKAKCAEGHKIKLYKTSDPDPGRKFVVTDSRTGKRWATDDLMRLFVLVICVGISIWQLWSMVTNK